MELFFDHMKQWTLKKMTPDEFRGHYWLAKSMAI